MRGPLVLAAASLVCAGACTQKVEEVSRATVIATIQKAEAAQAAALARDDLVGAYAVFADDAMLFTPGFPPAIGREAITAVNQRVLKDPAFNAVIDEASRKWWVSASGDLATTTYRIAWSHTDAASGKPIAEQLVSQTTWSRQADGSWKNVMDINAVYPEGN